VGLLRSLRVGEEKGFSMTGSRTSEADGRGPHGALEAGGREGVVRYGGYRSPRRGECMVPNMATHSFDRTRMLDDLRLAVVDYALLRQNGLLAASVRRHGGHQFCRHVVCSLFVARYAGRCPSINPQDESVCRHDEPTTCDGRWLDTMHDDPIVDIQGAVSRAQGNDSVRLLVGISTTEIHVRVLVCVQVRTCTCSTAKPAKPHSLWWRWLVQDARRSDSLDGQSPFPTSPPSRHPFATAFDWKSYERTLHRGAVGYISDISSTLCTTG